MPVINFDMLVSWSQFSQLSSRPSSKEEDAQISQQISFNNFQLQRTRGVLTIKDVNVVITLVSSECWVVSSQMSNNLLKHEQGHYDLLALSARGLYKALLGLSASTAMELQASAQELLKSFGERAKIIDDRYDHETKNSRNTVNQQLWDSRISSAKLNPQGTLASLP